MFFWFFMLATALMMPVILIVCGKMLYKKTPQKVNPVWGYRTSMSMKNQETWDFSNRYIGNLWYKCGVVMLPTVIILFLFVIGKEEDVIGILGVVLIVVQECIMIGAIFPTEIALKKRFDKDGNRRYFLKETTEDNAKILFDWANDPVTRSNSFHSEPIRWEEHISWLKGKLSDENCFFYLMYHDEGACGTIRIDCKEADENIQEPYGVISFSIAPQYRGKGLGHKIISLAEQELKGKKDFMNCVLIGEVKKENEASRKCFEKNNYILVKEQDGELRFSKKI